MKFGILARRDRRLISFFLTPILPRRLGRVFRHPRVPVLPSGFTHARDLEARDLELAERLLGFWRAMQESQRELNRERDPDVWTRIASRQTNFLDILDTQDPRVLVAYLNDAPNRSVLQGILQGDLESRMFRSSSYRELKSRLTLDRFLSLMEAIGALAIQNPEQGPWGINRAHLNYEALLGELDKFCGTEVIVPHVFEGLFVTVIGGRQFNAVDLMAINSALQMRNKLKSSALKSIIEIGAGSGRTVYWCVRFGLGPIQTIDLPHVAVVQAWYLAKALPDTGLHLYGEPITAAPPAVSIFPDSALGEVRNDNVGIVFNQDSFPEMSESAFLRYLDWILASAPQMLLSVNHESEAAYAEGARHLNPSRIMGSIKGYELLDRQRNWIRRGYVDELYAIHQKPRMSN